MNLCKKDGEFHKGAILYREVRRVFSDEVTFEQVQKEKRRQIIWVSQSKESQAEENLSSKAWCKVLGSMESSVAGI